MQIGEGKCLGEHNDLMDMASPTNMSSTNVTVLSYISSCLLLCGQLNKLA